MLRPQRDKSKHWDQNLVRYKEFCKNYYINLVLSNKLQQVLAERQEIIARYTRAAGINAESQQRIRQRVHQSGYDRSANEQKQARL